MNFIRNHRISINRLVKGMMTIFLMGVSFFLLNSCTTQGTFEIQISGSSSHNLQGTFFYESTPTGRQIYIEETGTGEDIRVFTISFPTQESPTNLRLASQGSVTGSYFEFIGGVSRQYWRNVSGNLSLIEAGDPISGMIDFTAFAPDSNDSIHITGTFQKIYLKDSNASFGNFATFAIIMILILVIGINFILQFYVGQKVYVDEGSLILKSLRGTRTFILGWQVPELRTTMILWSIVLVSLLLILCGLGSMALAYR